MDELDTKLRYLFDRHVENIRESNDLRKQREEFSKNCKKLEDDISKNMSDFWAISGEYQNLVVDAAKKEKPETPSQPAGEGTYKPKRMYNWGGRY